MFPPLAKMRLCEIVRTDHTSPQALDAALELALRVGKTPVVVRDGPGFFTTRVLAAYLMAAVELLQEGHRIEDIDLGAMRAGWPTGPLSLLDSIGMAGAVEVAEVLVAALEHPSSAPGLLRVPPLAQNMAKAGETFYTEDTQAQRNPCPEVYALLGAMPTPSADPEELGDRLTLVAALEAVRCLQDGVISCPTDGNVAAVLGLGYPAHRGGPFAHLAVRGLASLRGRLAVLEERFGGLYRAPPLLLELAKQGRDFSGLEGSS